MQSPQASKNHLLRLDDRPALAHVTIDMPVAVQIVDYECDTGTPRFM